MNKQELIKHFEDLPYVSVSQMGKKAFIDMIEQLDEPQKPVVPQFVANWYEEHKSDLDYELWNYVSDWKDQKPSEFKEWFNKSNKAFQTLVNMHQFGYEVEKEPRYTVKIKGRLGQYLGKYYLNNEELTPQFTRTQYSEGSNFTRTELEANGFGWVFSCEGVEVREVE